MLANEPFCLTIEDIGKLTLWQINKIYNHPRDKNGLLIFDSQDEPRAMNPEEQFKSYWRKLGVPEHAISRLWRERGTPSNDGD